MDFLRIFAETVLVETEAGERRPYVGTGARVVPGIRLGAGFVQDAGVGAIIGAVVEGSAKTGVEELKCALTDAETDMKGNTGA